MAMRDTTLAQLPLAGSIIVDLSDECLCLGARWLSDFGADVIRVESATGDALRLAGPMLDDRQAPEHGLRHILYNAGKRSLALNLESDDAWQLLDRLLSVADLVLAPLQKSPRTRQFFDRRRLARAHPQLGVIDVVMRRGGEDLPASDLVAVAAGGLMQGLGYPDAAPDYPAGKLAYKQASQVAVGAATAMLYDQRLRPDPAHARHVERHVSISLQEAVLSTTIHFANENMWRCMGEKAFRPGGDIPTLVQAGDGEWLTFGITPNTPARYTAFARWLYQRSGYDGLLDSEYPGDIWATPWGSDEHRAFERACASLPRDELCAEAQALGFLAVPVNSVHDIVEDPHLHERGAFVSVEHPQLQREITMPRLPIHSTAYQPVARPAPALGADSAQVLSELIGVTSDEYTVLRERGIVSGAPTLPAAAQRAQPLRPAEVDNRRESAVSELPLRGIRVIDFCWQAAGPLTTELLANLGADVIKIESEARIDTLRVALNAHDSPTIETGAFFQDCNTDKRSVNLDLSAPDGLRVAYDLIRDADVVTDNFTGGVMKRLGLGFDDLKQINPQIVTASLPVMGTWGPKAAWKGIGNSVVALCGLHAHTGDSRRKPTGVLLHTDFTLGPLAAAAIVAALIQRERTGLGQEIEIPQYEAGIHLLDTELIERLANGVTPPRRGNHSPEMAPHGLYRCDGDDRWLALAARDTDDWLNICEVIDRADLSARDDLRSLAGRQAKTEELDAAITAWTSEQELWSAARRFEQAGVPAGPNEDIEELVESDPSLAGFFHEFEHPVGIRFMAQNQPLLWNGERLPIRRAPLFGEHNEEVYRRLLGLTEEQLTELIVGGVIH